MWDPQSLQGSCDEDDQRTEKNTSKKLKEKVMIMTALEKNINRGGNYANTSNGNYEFEKHSTKIKSSLGALSL